MGGDRRNVKSDGGIPPSSDQTYCGEYRLAYGEEEWKWIPMEDAL